MCAYVCMCCICVYSIVYVSSVQSSVHMASLRSSDSFYIIFCLQVRNIPKFFNQFAVLPPCAAGVPSLKDLCLRSCSLLQQVCLEQLPPSLVKEVEDVRRGSST